MAEGDLEIAYDYSHVPTLWDMYQAQERHKIVVGPFGSGKSSGVVMEIIQRAIRQDACKDGIARVRVAVVRNTFPQLRDTTMKTFMDWFPPRIFGKYNATRHDYLITTLKNHQGKKLELEVCFRPLDSPEDVKNLLSLELTFVWFNEMREISKPIFEAMDGRITRYPPQRMRPDNIKKRDWPTWCGILMDTNPPHERSWVFKTLLKDAPEGVWSSFQPPGALADIDPRTGGYINIRNNPEAENVANLKDDYYTEMANNKPREFIKVNILGEIGLSFAGKVVFPEYRDGVHYNSAMKVEARPGLPIIRGWDFGLSPACVFLTITPGGKILVFDEVISDNMGIERLVQKVQGHCTAHYPGAKFSDYGDPAGAQRAQTDEKTCFQIMKAAGIDILPGRQTWAIRRDSVKAVLGRYVDGEPGFQVGPGAPTVRDGFLGGYHYRQLKTSDERYQEVPEKNEFSHPHDGLQYPLTIIVGDGLLGFGGGEELPPLQQPEPDEFGFFI